MACALCWVLHYEEEKEEERKPPLAFRSSQVVEEMEEQRGESRSWEQRGHRQRGSEKASRGVRGYVLVGTTF